MPHFQMAALAILLIALSLACASPPEFYEPTRPYYVERQVVIEDGKPQVERGRPHWLPDGLNHYFFSLPSKLLLWNWQLLDHELPKRSERILEHYVELNQLRSVKIRHNQYDPVGEFKRLRRNQEVGAGYRYTLGLVGWLWYTLFPDRLFGGLPIIGVGDHFNPFTNTVNVYSSDVTILVHEGGHAKDYTQHTRKGTSFALLRLLPGIDVVQEAKASNDAIRYFHCVRDLGDELRAYRVLIPAYSTYIAGYVPGGLELMLPVVLAGHVTGRVQAQRRLQRSIEDVELGTGPSLPPWCGPISWAEQPESPLAPEAREPPHDQPRHRPDPSW
jgi:hypothetical protein